MYFWLARSPNDETTPSSSASEREREIRHEGEISESSSTISQHTCIFLLQLSFSFPLSACDIAFALDLSTLFASQRSFNSSLRFSSPESLISISFALAEAYLTVSDFVLQSVEGSLWAIYFDFLCV